MGPILYCPHHYTSSKTNYCFPPELPLFLCVWIIRVSFLIRISCSFTSKQCPDLSGNVEISCSPHPPLENTSLPAKITPSAVQTMLSSTWWEFLEMPCANPRLGLADPLVSLPTQSILSFHGSTLERAGQELGPKMGMDLPSPEMNGTKVVFSTIPWAL